ncbi:hypothetical protein GCM10022243_03810 [Saccharothrix violaceirubra]|uniref:Uncharacterized protein n=1 Tax=Saccharothrix violaceirubra TaxID=413306 RepID=A0A7W7WV39_9PSEU|nr:hypothetical protein [Saccharothrix violaceirubra]MBB4964128.1 hypothetical protein [Saccharothrix violaceirubra]
MPFGDVDVEHDEAARDQAVVLPDGTVLVEPTDTELATALGR